MTEGERNTDRGSWDMDCCRAHLHEMFLRVKKKQQALLRLWEALRADDMEALRSHAGELCRLSGLPVKESDKK